MKRPPLITVLAVLQFIGAAFGLVVLIILTAGGLGGVEAGLPALFFGVLGALQLACGIGLWKLRSYGRTLQLVFAWIGLLAIPIGTIISILILVYLFKPGIKLLFSGRPAGELTAEESAQIAAISQSSLAIVLAVLALVVVLVVVLGIAAAIAVPALVRARTAGNEASAVASLRTINSAQAAFATSCGNGFYAATLAGLAAPPTTGGGMGFLSGDLAADPVVKSGYAISLTPGDPVPNTPAACNGARLSASYFVAASPVTPGETGSRFFATNQGMTIFQAPAAIPVTQSGMPSGATPVY